LEFEEDEEEGGAGAGSPDSFPARVPGGYKKCTLYNSRSGVWNLLLYLLVAGKTSPGLPILSKLSWPF